MSDEDERVQYRRPLFVVSGGFGKSGEQLVRTALAQFSADVPIVVVPHITDVKGLEDVVKRAAEQHATIVHTLVDGHLRATLIRMSRDHNVFAIDPMGPLLARLATELGQEPVGQPGLYHKLQQEYFSRVEAIEFTVAHDDGKKTDELDMAEIVLIGPSRVGKTPLSIYLSVLGWRVANIPLIRDIPPPEQLFQIDRRRVVGLTLDLSQLIAHRRRRYRRLGLAGKSEYVDSAQIQEELRVLERVSRRGGFPLVDTTDRPVEESAEAVIGLVEQRTGREGLNSPDR